MNIEADPSVEELRKLLRACDDTAGHHVLWVSRAGDVHITRVPKDRTPAGFHLDRSDIQLRFETFEAGNGYVGGEAADDDDWVRQLSDSLARAWRKAKGKPAVEYADQF